MLSAASIDLENVKGAVTGTHWEFMTAIARGLAESNCGSAFTAAQAQERLVQSSRLLALSCEMESKALAVRAEAINMFGTTVAGVDTGNLWSLLKNTFGQGVTYDPTQDIVTSGSETEGPGTEDEHGDEGAEEEIFPKGREAVATPDAEGMARVPRTSPRVKKSTSSVGAPDQGPPAKKARTSLDLSKMRVPAGEELPAPLRKRKQKLPIRIPAPAESEVMDLRSHTAFIPTSVEDSLTAGVPQDKWPVKATGTGASVYYCSFRHVDGHHGVFCPKAIKSKQTMVNHIRKVHLQTCLACSYCTSRFSSSDAWVKHQKAKHQERVLPAKSPSVKLVAVEGVEKEEVEDSAAEAIQLFADLGKSQQSPRRSSPRT